MMAASRRRGEILERRGEGRRANAQAARGDRSPAGSPEPGGRQKQNQNRCDPRLSLSLLAFFLIFF